MASPLWFRAVCGAPRKKEQHDEPPDVDAWAAAYRAEHPSIEEEELDENVRAYAEHAIKWATGNKRQKQ